MILEEAWQERHRQRVSQAAQSGTQQHTSLVDVEEHVRAFVTRQPVAAALIAVGVGYVVGRIVSRR